MIASISKQLVVAVIAIVGAAIPASASAQIDPTKMIKTYFFGTYSVSDCPRPQVRQTMIDSTFGTSKTSACGEYLNKELQNEIWEKAIGWSQESKACYEYKDAVHAPSWYKFRCHVYAQAYGPDRGMQCEVANKRNYVTTEYGRSYTCYK